MPELVKCSVDEIVSVHVLFIYRVTLAGAVRLKLTNGLTLLPGDVVTICGFVIDADDETVTTKLPEPDQLPAASRSWT
jgi:hypothetical protein